MQKTIALLFTLGCSIFQAPASAEQWCDIEQGWSLVTHGNISDAVYIFGKLKQQSNSSWIIISDGIAGKNNVSMALAAAVAGRNLRIYLDAEEDTCANFPSWAPMGRIRHISFSD
ncbi:hypothetical protein GCM10009092_01140 [Bowmanella denitrificans]|uniref:Lipoprotein n=1 Tax=Bowmanella denitrificans TaxID=366582 RepID=A0ABN0WKI4_9ALTE